MNTWDQKQMDNGRAAAIELMKSRPSDEIIVNHDVYEAIRELRGSIVGDDVDLVSDIIWSKTIPLRDFIASVGEDRIRYCIFEDAIKALDDAPTGRTLLVGALQELGGNAFWLFGVTKGENRADISTEFYDEYGNSHSNSKILDTVKSLWKFWHGVQLALLHPQTKEVFANPKIVKERRRVKDETTGKRKRETWYIRRHVIGEESIKQSTREIKRHCLAWYVVGHWRHYKDGSVTYVNGYWKGELRHMKRNIDQGRNRKVVV